MWVLNKDKNMMLNLKHGRVFKDSYSDIKLDRVVYTISYTETSEFDMVTVLGRYDDENSRDATFDRLIQAILDDQTYHCL